MNTVVRALKNAEEFYKDWWIDLNLDSMGDSVISFKHFLSIEEPGGRVPTSQIMTSIGCSETTTDINRLIDLYGKAGRLTDEATVEVFKGEPLLITDLLSGVLQQDLPLVVELLVLVQAQLALISL
ncbi:hypothetical protein ABKV19_013091 [Rosa sericea]